MTEPDQIIFIINGDGEADLHPLSKQALETWKTRDRNAMFVADIMQDIAAVAERERRVALDTYKGKP